MTIQLRLQGSHITFAQDDVMLGNSRLALLADVDHVVTIDPNSHARIATPISFTGDGKTIALIDMHAGRLGHALGQTDDVATAQGEYFLPAPGHEAIVHVDVINETGATLMIRPGVNLGILTFINLNSEPQDIEAGAEPSLEMQMFFEPQHISADQLPGYGHGTAGIDLKADLPSSITIAPNSSAVVSTGSSVNVPFGHEAHVRTAPYPAKDLDIGNRPFDALSCGVIQVILNNNSGEPVTINPGEVIAQIVVTPVSHPTLIYPATDTRLGETRLGAGR